MKSEAEIIEGLKFVDIGCDMPDGSVIVPNGSLIAYFDGKPHILRPGEITWEELPTGDPEPNHVVVKE